MGETMTHHFLELHIVCRHIYLFIHILQCIILYIDYIYIYNSSWIYLASNGSSTKVSYVKLNWSLVNLCRKVVELHCSERIDGDRHAPKGGDL